MANGILRPSFKEKSITVTLYNDKWVEENVYFGFVNIPNPIRGNFRVHKLCPVNLEGLHLSGAINQ